MASEVAFVSAEPSMDGKEAWESCLSWYEFRAHNLTWTISESISGGELAVLTISLFKIHLYSDYQLTCSYLMYCHAGSSLYLSCKDNGIVVFLFFSFPP